MMKYVSENIKYPQAAKDKNIAGRVFVSFVVEKDGSVNEVKVMRGIGGGCDEEAVRVIKGMPKWKPGMQKGKPVRVSYMMPLNFKLSDDQPEKPAQQTDANKPNMKPDKNGVIRSGTYTGKTPKKQGEHSVYIGSNVEYAVDVEFNATKKHDTGKAHFLKDAATTHTDQYKEIN